MKKQLFLIVIFLFSIISNSVLYSQNISVNIDVDDLYSSECSDQWGTPDFRYFLKLYINGSDVANWNPAWDDHPNCGWISESNFSFYDNSNISPYTYMNLNYNAFEEDSPWGTDGNCGGYSSANGNITIRDYSEGSWHYFTNTRNCDGITWGVEYSFLWNYVTVNTPSATPTVNNDNSCNPTLNVVSSDQDNVTWYWQTSSSGTSTAYVSTSPPPVPVGVTTFYLRARGDLNGVWSSSATSVAVTRKSESIAASSISGSSNICLGESTTLSVVGGFLGTGASWKWYANSCGGTFLGSGTSISVNPASSTSYYVRAEGDCNTTSCVSITVSVGSTPQSISTIAIAGLSVSTNPNPIGASLGKSGGLTITFSNASWPACNNYGVSTTLAAINLNNASAPDGACTYNNLTYDALNAETNLAQGKVCFTGTDSYYCISSGGAWVSKTVNVRLRMNVFKSDGVTSKPLSSVGSYITAHANENLVVKVYIEADASGLDNCLWTGTDYFSLGGWHGVVDIYDALHTDLNRSLCTGFDYNWYNITSNTSIDLASTNLICTGDNVGLVGNSTMGNCYTQIWTGPNGFNTTTENPTITNFQSLDLGTYQLLISDNRSCFGMSTLTISDLYSNGDWVGTAMDGNWHTSANWCGGVPDDNENIRLVTDAASWPVIQNQDVEVCGITIESSASLTISNNRNLNVNCNFYNYGTFISGSGSETVNIMGNNCDVLSGGASFNNFVIEGVGSSVNMKDNFNIKKDFLINDGEINTSSFAISLVGTQQQNVRTNSQNIHRIVFNNSSADNLGIVLLDNLTVTSDATFTNGIVKAGSNKLIISNSATINAGNQNCFLDGEVQISTTGTVDLPLGDYTNRDIGNGITTYKIWAPITIECSNPTTVNASYHFSNDDLPAWLHSNGSMDTNIHHVSSREYWLVSSSQDIDNVTLFWYNNEHLDGVSCTHGFDYGYSSDFNPDDLTVAYWSGLYWKNAGGIVSGNHDNGSITSTSAIPFGAKSQTFITFGSENNMNPLPVEIVDFYTICNEDNVDIQWTTASEINNDFFVIERSNDVIKFEEISIISGSGFSNSLIHYNYTDIKPQKGVLYYRLKQVDYDGAFIYSDIISTDCVKKLYEPIINVYPNPFKDEITIQFYQESIDNVFFEVYSSIGKLVYKSVQNGSSSVTLNLHDLPKGVYVLKVFNEIVGHDTYKIVKN